MIIHAHAGRGIEIDLGRVQPQAFDVRGSAYAHEDFIDTQFLTPAGRFIGYNLSALSTAHLAYVGVQCELYSLAFHPLLHDAGRVRVVPHEDTLGAF